MTDASPIDLLSDARRALLQALKRAGWATIPQLAQTLSVSTEAVRQQLSYLQRSGWVGTNCGPDEPDERAPGRPPAEYCLTSRGDGLFPKRYPELAVTLFDALDDPEETLAELTDRRVSAVQSVAGGDPRQNTLEALRSIYRPDDPYTEIEQDGTGYRLIEGNCPYLQFATERPLFCSTTVSALRRLTHGEVVREERFQDGDGRCVFHIYTEAPVSAARQKRRFEVEPAKDARPRGTG